MIFHLTVTDDSPTLAAVTPKRRRARYSYGGDMSELNRLTDLLAKSFDGPAWHGPSLEETLKGVDAARAAARPIPDAHSIWELVLHIAAWDNVVRRRLLGEAVVEPDEGDFPAIDATDDAGWQAALARLSTNAAGLRDAVAAIADDEVEAAPPENTTPRWISISGVVQHRAYHAGQIALLRKAT